MKTEHFVRFIVVGVTFTINPSSINPKDKIGDVEDTDSGHSSCILPHVPTDGSSDIKDPSRCSNTEKRSDLDLGFIFRVLEDFKVFRK